MFLDKYLNSTYLDLVYTNYEDFYLNSLDEYNFKKVYDYLINNKFTFIDDIILNYLELFEIDIKYIEKALKDIKEILGINYVNIISNNMSILDKLIEIAMNYAMADN